MPSKIKNKLEIELIRHMRQLDRSYGLSAISPLLFKSIRSFILRKGKRIRPALFVIGYLGYTGKPISSDIYRSALSLELFHNFMLIHDDIIDDSDLRRGLPSMHNMLNKSIAGNKNLKFDGKDLAIVAGDCIYAMAISSFLAANVKFIYKEKALKRLTEAALYTTCGEWLELLHSIRELDSLTKEDIYKIYDLKTACYTFASPLAIGAMIAGAKDPEIDKLSRYGIYLGRIFQIKDDIMDMFGNTETLGKKPLTDIREGKKTILLWAAYKLASNKNKAYIKKMLVKKYLSGHELNDIRDLVLSSGSLAYAKDEIAYLSGRAKKMAASLNMRPKYRKMLESYSDSLLDLKSIPLPSAPDASRSRIRPAGSKRL